MNRTFLDSGVLIAAARGNMAQSLAALNILSDRDREFASSAFIQLETLPKATYHNQQAEVRFYESFFSRSPLKKRQNQCTALRKLELFQLPVNKIFAILLKRSVPCNDLNQKPSLSTIF